MGEEVTRAQVSPLSWVFYIEVGGDGDFTLSL
jgi:hypothetical protein